MKKIIIASKNPVKIRAIKNGFNKMFPHNKFVFEDVVVPSGVSDQPMTDAETLRGAENRMKNARQNFPESDYWVGIEGGAERRGEEIEVFAWIVIENKTKKGKARTSSFFLPNKVTRLINQGMELGQADDIIFNRKNSKQQNGAIGILTGNVITRENYYTEAVILALIPFRNSELY